MDKQEKDMNILDFCRSISMLSIDTPMANKFDEEFGQKKDRWWTCQREHLTVWCLYQPTIGFQKFKHRPNCSARVMYYKFNRPETLLWLAESLGEKEKVLTEVINKIKNITNCRSACVALRQTITFDRILELIENSN